MTDTERRCGARHWFAYYGWPGSSAPTCRRCGAPNPRYDQDRDPHAGQGAALTRKGGQR